jgi:hypothetical protein
LKDFKSHTIDTYNHTYSERNKAIEDYLNSVSVDGFRINFNEERNSHKIDIITWLDGYKAPTPIPQNMSKNPRNGLCSCDDSMLASDSIHCINCQGVIINK